MEKDDSDLIMSELWKRHSYKETLCNGKTKVLSWVTLQCKRCGRFIPFSQVKYCKSCSLIITNLDREEDYVIMDNIRRYTYGSVRDSIGIAIPQFIVKDLRI